MWLKMKTWTGSVSTSLGLGTGWDVTLKVFGATVDMIRFTLWRNVLSAVFNITERCAFVVCMAEIWVFLYHSFKYCIIYKNGNWLSELRNHPYRDHSIISHSEIVFAPADILFLLQFTVFLSSMCFHFCIINTVSLKTNKDSWKEGKYHVFERPLWFISVVF